MQSGLSARFWGYVIQLAAKIRGNTPTSANPQKKTPNELFGQGLDVTVMEQFPFGCYTVVQRDKGKEGD
eukprot:3327535-Rhodomonas_salina.1